MSAFDQSAEVLNSGCWICTRAWQDTLQRYQAESYQLNLIDTVVSLFFPHRITVKCLLSVLLLVTLAFSS